MIRHYRGKVKLQKFTKAASETFSYNDLVYVNNSGYITKAVDGSSIVPIGLIQQDVTATDSDYASNSDVEVLVPVEPNTEFLCDVSTGTAAQTNVGEWIDIDDHNSVDVSASTYDIFFVTEVSSTTQVVAKMAQKSGATA